MLFKSHGHSDVGFVRENNEDSFVVDDAKGIFAVADGVGGLPFGNLASRLAVRFFASMIRSSEDACTIEELKEIVQKVHASESNADNWSGVRMGLERLSQPFGSFPIRSFTFTSEILRSFERAETVSPKFPKAIPWETN